MSRASCFGLLHGPRAGRVRGDAPRYIPAGAVLDGTPARTAASSAPCLLQEVDARIPSAAVQERLPCFFGLSVAAPDLCCTFKTRHILG